MENVTYLILGAALIAGGGVAYRGSAWVYVRALGAAAAAAGAVMFLIALVNALSGTG